ncbi:LysR substrate-binding domain-containing protein [Paenarthrobacter sp. YJN-5]|uniref:LysR substrate-binding domain-containing protein n=1 Tax=Paenarthrobacter sp. YJN-5 TaxID=2735316 RepID=UPI002106ACE4|nr:LysR substrate-binding domain-containing protein [Paenarthrobacter sp. YJN-5]
MRELHHRKTLSAVAEALSYSTSAVSQQVRLLEKEIGVALVEPAGRRLQLTPQGLTLVAHAEKILDMLERAEADVSVSMEQIRGTLKVAAFQTAALTCLPRVILELREHHPELTIEFHQGEPEETLPALQSGEYDLVIAEAYPGMPPPTLPGIDYRELFEDPLWITMSASTAATIDPDSHIIGQLAEAGWAVEAQDSVPRTWVINECRKAGFEPRITCSSEDLAVQLQFVEAGLAVAVLPSLALEKASSSVRRFPLSEGMQKRSILAAYRAAAQDRPAVKATLQALKRAAKTSQGPVHSDPYEVRRG